MHAPALLPVKAALPVLKYNCTILESFDDQTYPEGLTRPFVTESGSLVYPMDFLWAFKAYNVPPVGLPPIEIFTEEAGGNNARRGTSSRQNSFGGPGVGGGAPPKGGAGRYPSTKGGVMPTVQAPMRMGSNRSSLDKPQRMGSEGGRRGGRGGRGGGGGGRGDYNNNQSNPNDPPVEPIKMSENGWTPDTLKKKKVIYETEEAAIEAHEAEVCKKVKGLLNKLTIEKFDSISGHFLELPITNPSILRK
ncbi:UNVERIFIED_CONTAM: hypothetical protein HDU68_006783, partial [Siphonaria sp. JEL0065]